MEVTGDTDNNCINIKNPCKTMNNVISMLQSGDVLNIRNGVSEWLEANVDCEDYTISQEYRIN